MSLVHIASLDLNLLRGLDALIAECSVTRAARRVALTQPAMSRVLGRLRVAFDDPLLVRSGQAFVPSPRAEALRPRLREALLLLDGIVGDAPRFDPRTTRRTFHLATVDQVQAVALPRITALLSQVGPAIDLVVHAWAPGHMESLTSGALDAVIAPHQTVGAGLVRTRLYADDFVCIARRGNDALRDPRRGKAATRMSLSRYTELSHVLVAPNASPSSIVDTALARLGKRRRVALMVPSFLVAPIIVSQSDFIATLGRRIALLSASYLPLTVLPVPLELPATTVSLAWHERMRNDPGHTWFRRLLVSALGGGPVTHPHTRPREHGSARPRSL